MALNKPNRRQSGSCRIRAVFNILLAHELFLKPVPIPDHVEDMLFGIMRYP
jgi:hypothetical protein